MGSRFLPAATGGRTRIPWAFRQDEPEHLPFRSGDLGFRNIKAICQSTPKLQFYVASIALCKHIFFFFTGEDFGEGLWYLSPTWALQRLDGCRHEIWLWMWCFGFSHLQDCFLRFSRQPSQHKENPSLNPPLFLGSMLGCPGCIFPAQAI